MKTLAIIGGGAAGFFAAINAAMQNKELRVVIFEKGNKFLGKVKVSGGGRCNVTHSCFNAKDLVKNYPRGDKELLGPFHHFQPTDMFEWLQARNVELKTEEDGRVFPVTNSSQTIIDCFLKEAESYGVELKTTSGISGLNKKENGWELEFPGGEKFFADKVVIASGSSQSIWNLLAEKGHNIVEPVPSLFTFTINDSRLDGLAGLSAPHCEVRIEGTKTSAQGPVLVTHRGLSGPAVLRLSALAARELATLNYDFTIGVNWDVRYDRERGLEFLREWKSEHTKQFVKTFSALKVPHRLWCGLLSQQPELMEMKWADVSNKQLEHIAECFVHSFFHVTGKDTFKEEFVTAGGVSLKEVDFRSMQSKLLPGIFFAGEVLDIDAITGGFNFQAAWTTAWIAAKAISV
ncbi:MAG: aminoacetone oxidase family FAD-binding enzyme [Flavobacteriales bacterium]|nr:aminoacetone oxidase family FAD-binding enzyme [Flavobacteriales bacterium]